MINIPDSIIIGAKVSTEIHEKLKEISRVRGQDVSAFIRGLIYRELAKVGMLTADERRMLGIK